MVQEWCKNGAVVLSICVGFREGEGREFIAELVQWCKCCIYGAIKCNKDCIRDC